MSSAYRSERDLSPEELVELAKAKKKMEHWKSNQPNHDISPEDAALSMLRMFRLTPEEEQSLSDADYDAYYDAPATDEEKEEVRQMMAGEGEWADTGPHDYPKKVMLGYWPYADEEKA